MYTFTIKCNHCGAETEFYQDLVTLNIPELGCNNQIINIKTTEAGGIEIECRHCGFKIGDD
jgi:predicted RNA-binding Zn-ribbon protein involved in translation (DUF1610 family)